MADIVHDLKDVAVMTENVVHETLAWRAADEITRLRVASDALLRSLNEIDFSGRRSDMDAFLAAVRRLGEVCRG